MSEFRGPLLYTAVLVIAVYAVNASSAQASKQRPVRNKARKTDRYGDPLPEGAIARLGTVRLRPCRREATVAFSSDNRTLACCVGWGFVAISDTSTGKAIRLIRPGDRHLHDCVFSPEGKSLAVVGDETISLWDVRTGKALTRVKRSDHGEYLSVAFAPNGKTFATGDTGWPALDKTPAVWKEPSIQIWDSKTGKKLTRLLGHCDYYIGMVVSN